MATALLLVTLAATPVAADGGIVPQPLLRLTEAGFEVNRASPSWNDHARLDPDGTVGDVVEDPDAEPVWEMALAAAPTVDGERHDVAVETVWNGDEVTLFRLTVPGLVAASLGAGPLAAAVVRLWERRRGGSSDGATHDTPTVDEPA